MNEEPSIQRRLAAILAADIAGYSRFMHEDEAATVRDLKSHQSVILPLVGRHGGRIIDTAGSTRRTRCRGRAVRQDGETAER
jgi:class 3 adenylate cyclase